MQARMARAALYAAPVFLVLFFLMPSLLTIVWSFFQRTMFWMEPDFTLFAYVNFFTSARLENFPVVDRALLDFGRDLLRARFSDCGFRPASCASGGAASRHSAVHPAVHGLGGDPNLHAAAGAWPKRLDQYGAAGRRAHLGADYVAVVFADGRDYRGGSVVPALYRLCRVSRDGGGAEVHFRGLSGSRREPLADLR